MTLIEDGAPDRQNLAAEFVLGTLDTQEREDARTLMAEDAGFAEEVHYWERRLSQLHAMVNEVEPPARIWPLIEAAIGGTTQEAPPALPLPSPDRPSADIVELSRRITRWKVATSVAAAIAATLILFVAVRGNILPPKSVATAPEATVSESTVAQAGKGALVAVLAPNAVAPAYLLTFDPAARNLTVRRVSAQDEPGKSHELWIISDRFPVPRSLGVVDETAPQNIAMGAYEADVIEGATYAISLEPAGGSTTGAPTGPVLYSGKLLSTSL
jgi:anti-sigma-K factor RskA